MSDALASLLPPAPSDPGPSLPAIFQASPDASRRFLESFTVTIRNRNTRKAYFRAVAGFAEWCAERSLVDLAAVTPMHVATWWSSWAALIQSPQ